MICSIEPAAATLRLYKDDARPNLDPYILAATVIFLDDGRTAELRGIVTGPDISIIRARSAIFTALRELGVQRVQWQRKKGDRSRWVSATLST